METKQHRQCLSPLAARAILIALAVFAIWSWFTPTLTERLNREAARRFPPGTPRETIQEWLKTQPARVDTFEESSDSIGQETVLMRAGLEGAGVAYEIRADYRETRSLIIPYEISLYFYFGQDNKLIKHWIEEFERGP